MGSSYPYKKQTCKPKPQARHQCAVWKSSGLRCRCLCNIRVKPTGRVSHGILQSNDCSGNIHILERVIFDNTWTLNTFEHQHAGTRRASNAWRLHGYTDRAFGTMHLSHIERDPGDHHAAPSTCWAPRTTCFVWPSTFSSGAESVNKTSGCWRLHYITFCYSLVMTSSPAGTSSEILEMGSCWTFQIRLP